MDSILNSVKKTLGIDEGYTHFDTDIVMHINTVFMILTQLGVGPDEGFIISGGDEVWSDFIDVNHKGFESIKTYMGLKVRLIFDPPTGSVVLGSLKEAVKELEWRINTLTELT